MLHPAVMVPIGVSVKLMGQIFAQKFLKNRPNNRGILIVRRLLTYSINVHLALIAVLIYYFYAVWIDLEFTSSMNFSNFPFNQCPCDVLLENGLPCVNEETENSFQNLFIGIPNQPFILCFLVVSILCHLVHSLCTILPVPISLLDYVIGQNSNEASTNNPQDALKQTGGYKYKRFVKGFKIACCFLTLTFIAVLLISPRSTFEVSLDKGNQNSFFQCISID